MANETDEREGLDQPAPVALLLKLRFAEGTANWLAEQGVTTVSANSVPKAAKLLERHPSIKIIVVWLSSGGTNPEKMVEHLKTINEPGGRYELVGAVGKSTMNAKRRAESLGIEKLVRWPEGVQSLMYKAAGVESTMRDSARAHVGQSFSPKKGSNVAGRLRNLSATGALLECDHAPDDSLLVVSFRVMPIKHRFELQAEPVRVRKVDDHYEVGVRFTNLDDATKKQLRRLVENLNENPLGTRRAKRTVKVRVRLEKGQTDYYTMEEFTHDGGWLMPRASYIHPPELGDKVFLQFHRPEVEGTLVGTVEQLVEAVAGQGMRIFVRLEEQADGPKDRDEMLAHVLSYRDGLPMRDSRSERVSDQEERSSEIGSSEAANDSHPRLAASA